MNTHTIKTTCSIITGLLIASASALAQVAPPTPAEAAGPSYFDGFDTSLVMPRATGPNLYFEGGGMFQYADLGGDKGSRDFYGPMIGLGWRIHPNHKVQLEAGALFDNKDHDYGKEEDFVVPVLASYSFCMPIDRKGHWEVRITPVVGLYTIKYELKHTVAGKDDDTDSAFVWGGGVGLTYHINKRFYLDVGYRYMRVQSSTYEIFDGKVELDAFNTHAATVAFGWKF